MPRAVNINSEVLLVVLREGQKARVARESKRNDMTVRDYIRTLIDNAPKILTTP